MVIFDWFGVLSRSWNNVLRRFSDRFLLAFNRFLFELRPIEVGICSYADTNRERYLVQCLRPARNAIVNLQAAPADFWLLQTVQRTGPEGKASFLRQVACNYFVDDNSLICREARRTGCIVIRSDASAGEQGLIDDLENIQQNLESRDRGRLPVARQLANFEFLYDPRAPERAALRLRRLVLSRPRVLPLAHQPGYIGLGLLESSYSCCPVPLPVC